MSFQIYPLRINPGIQRDGTLLAANSWTDGSWTRFQRGLPQKMGGYKAIWSSTVGVPRGTFIISDSPNFNIYYGTGTNLQYITVDQFGNGLGNPVDRTPLVFPANQNNDWQFDTMFSTISDANLLIAHAAPNLAAIDSEVETPIYYGDAMGNDRLISNGINVSGGIAVFHPFLFMFGNDGDVKISDANDPTTILNEARVTAKKIVAGLPTRGGNTSPAGLLWSLDSLIRVTQVGTTAVEFSFDTITSQNSLLSSRGIIEYDGIFMWAATDRFLQYNGTVSEIQNDKSINFFFRNINYAQRQKVWVTKVTQYGEIWWFFPKGNATECNWAVVYNVREGTWYDTPITRGDGYFDETFTKPIWTDNTVDITGNYPIWMHETGNNAVDFVGNTTAINSSITTPYLSWCTTGSDGKRNELDRWTDLYRFEPDMLQTGPMTLTVSGVEYARATPQVSAPYPYLATDVKIDLREQRREMQLTFTSNAIDGYYEMGQSLLVCRVGDARQ